MSFLKKFAGQEKTSQGDIDSIGSELARATNKVAAEWGNFLIALDKILAHVKNANVSVNLEGELQDVKQQNTNNISRAISVLLDELTGVIEKEKKRIG